MYSRSVSYRCITDVSCRGDVLIKVSFIELESYECFVLSEGGGILFGRFGIQSLSDNVDEADLAFFKAVSSGNNPSQSLRACRKCVCVPCISKSVKGKVL